MIKQLESADSTVATQIHSVFQSSYKIEADLIGVQEFPPLSRTIEQIKSSPSIFLGYMDGAKIAAVIEINLTNDTLDIDSLTVAPRYFKQGIAGKLIQHVLNNYQYSQAVVETAVLNMPAIRLYEKHGFVAFKRWTPAHGIEKIALRLNNRQA